MSKIKQYTLDERRHAVQVALSSSKPICQVAVSLGIPTGTLYAWTKKYKSEFPDLINKDDDEKSCLRREISELKMENDFLKKAAAFFAKQQ
jgi:transposase